LSGGPEPTEVETDPTLVCRDAKIFWIWVEIEDLTMRAARSQHQMKRSEGKNVTASVLRSFHTNEAPKVIAVSGVAFGSAFPTSIYRQVRASS